MSGILEYIDILVKPWLYTALAQNALSDTSYSLINYSMVHTCIFVILYLYLFSISISHIAKSLSKIMMWSLHKGEWKYVDEDQYLTTKAEIIKIKGHILYNMGMLQYTVGLGGFGDIIPEVMIFPAWLESRVYKWYIIRNKSIKNNKTFNKHINIKQW
jgi:hypothetical protein